MSIEVDQYSKWESTQSIITQDTSEKRFMERLGRGDKVALKR